MIPDDVMCDQCGASDWRHTGKVLACNPPIPIYRCAACGHEQGIRDLAIKTMTIEAIDAVKVEINKHLVLRWDRGRDPLDVAVGRPHLSGEVRLVEGDEDIFEHVVMHISGIANRWGKGWFRSNSADDIIRFAKIALLHGVTVMVHEFTRHGGKDHQVDGTIEHVRTSPRKDRTGLDFVVEEKLGIGMGNIDGISRVKLED